MPLPHDGASRYHPVCASLVYTCDTLLPLSHNLNELQYVRSPSIIPTCLQAFLSATFYTISTLNCLKQKPKNPASASDFQTRLGSLCMFFTPESPVFSLTKTPSARGRGPGRALILYGQLQNGDHDLGPCPMRPTYDVAHAHQVPHFSEQYSSASHVAGGGEWMSKAAPAALEMFIERFSNLFKHSMILKRSQIEFSDQKGLQGIFIHLNV